MDLTHALDQIGAVRRGLSSLDHRGTPARALTAEQTYAADAADVWDALTNPERLPRWFLPIEGDLRVGGRYQLEGNAGGTIERCEPPRSLAVTWEYGEGVSWLEVDLTESGDSTTLVLRHIAHPDERWDRYGPGAVGIGWDMSMLGLALHLATGESNDPDAYMAWAAGVDGQAFMRGSNDRWYDADVAAGAEPGDARLRADRTLAFYTGQEEPA
jgi:uncharacterized protein YndB with AHSA1/START domain